MQDSFITKVEVKTPTDSNPVEAVVILLIILNIAYWAFSEVYIHNGQVLEGIIYGVITSALSLGFGCLLGHALKKG